MAARDEIGNDMAAGFAAAASEDDSLGCVRGGHCTRVEYSGTETPNVISVDNRQCLYQKCHVWAEWRMNDISPWKPQRVNCVRVGRYLELSAERSDSRA